MCGHAGIIVFNRNAHPVDREELGRIGGYMDSRGPDAKGDWFALNGCMGLPIAVYLLSILMSRRTSL